MLSSVDSAKHKDGGKIGSLLLGLYNEHGEFHFIGHCSGFPDVDRVEIYDRFTELRSEDSFDEAARAPGGPSRWSGGKDNSWIPVQQGVVIEVSYDQLEGRPIPSRLPIPPAGDRIKTLSTARWISWCDPPAPAFERWSVNPAGRNCHTSRNGSGQRR